MATAEKCIEAIRALTTVPEIGTEYEGTVKRVEPYGAFVEILPGLDGLVHISELAPGRVRETTDVVKLGDKAKVKIIAIDPVNGKIKLSRRQALTPEEAAAEVERLGLNATPPEGEGGGDDRPPFRREGGFGNRDRGPRRDGPAASAARARPAATAREASAARAADASDHTPRTSKAGLTPGLLLFSARRSARTAEYRRSGRCDSLPARSAQKALSPASQRCMATRPRCRSGSSSAPTR